MRPLHALAAPLFVILVTVVPVASVPVPATPVAAAEVVAQMGPAEEVPAAEAEDEAPPWTSRYLIPTVVAMTVVVLLLVVAGYGSRVSGRYRVRR